MGWKVRVSGDRNDLGMLSKSFRKIKEISIEEEKDGYYLSSTEFETMTSIDDVKIKAQQIVLL